MTPRERTVVRAIAHALGGAGCDEMDALALSYRMPSSYSMYAPIRHRAMVLLLALVITDEEKNDVDAHQAKP